MWDIAEHKLEDTKTNGNCCFNHIIGLPTKEGAKKAMFDYEKYCTIPFFLLTTV
jgi:hypothetical protein